MPVSMMDRRALLAGLGASTFAIPAFAKAGDYPALKAFLDSYIESKRLCGGVLAIKRGDAPADFISAGNLDYVPSPKTTPDSIYRIYSMTKPITSMAAMRLIEEYKLRIDQPISEILPEFKDQRVINGPTINDTRPAVRPTTIRHLMTHSGGLSYQLNGNTVVGKAFADNGIWPGERDRKPGPGQKSAPTSLAELVSRIAALPLESDPGTRYQYSAGLDVLGHIIATVSGMEFHEYLTRTFFRPLGMNDTDFVVPASKVARLSSVYNYQGANRTLVDDRLNSSYAKSRDLQTGGAGIASTARDYIKFTDMLVHEGRGATGARILKPETVRYAMSDLLPNGIKARGGGHGAGGTVVTAENVRAGEDPVGTFSWYGAAGTQMWVDPVNKMSVVLMVQYTGAGYGVQREARVAAYKDLATLRA